MKREITDVLARALSWPIGLLIAGGILLRIIHCSEIKQTVTQTTWKVIDRIERPVPIVIVGAIEGQWSDSTYDTVWVRPWAQVTIKQCGTQIWPDHVYVKKSRYRGTIYLYDRRPQPVREYP
jgi:hypothetical protein